MSGRCEQTSKRKSDGPVFCAAISYHFYPTCTHTIQHPPACYHENECTHEQLMHSARFRGLIRHPKYSVSVLATFSSLPYSVSAKIFGLNFSLEKSIRWQQPFFWPVDPLTVIRTSIYDKIEYTPATLLILSLRYAMPTSWYMSCCKIFLKIMRIST